ncbi:hypothetical protein QO259_17620 [Salinicola sp. JS01]|uniref:DUF6789 family protein n=1 Tax=Salinicola sp. JS01 TaxID=3050071 RepID=UPI00255C2572|nr:DUF6789 family protein [Salinicola sp. JS01]WIX32605.1 hypothetical protein QO259_17620 [Salinicola sp. JS01]
MSGFKHGLIAGFVATVVLSAIMVMKASMGIMPNLDPIHMLAQMMHSRLGLPATPILGWIMHFAIGTILWGGLFSLLAPLIPAKSFVAKGLIFASGAWLLMMLIPMPMSGAGFFAIKIGPMAPVMTLVLHWIWGAVLGLTFQKLAKTSNQG